jgi:hypothetical protein
MVPSHPPPSSKRLSGRYPSFARAARRSPCRALGGTGVGEVARRLSCAPSAISRELRRSAAARGGGLEHRARTAQSPRHGRAVARRPVRAPRARPKPAKLAVKARLRGYVQDRPAGRIEAPDGAAISGPPVPWRGRRHRGWAGSWSPEQIARRLRLDFPGAETMRISQEAIRSGRSTLRAAGAQP